MFITAVCVLFANVLTFSSWFNSRNLPQIERYVVNLHSCNSAPEVSTVAAFHGHSDIAMGTQRVDAKIQPLNFCSVNPHPRNSGAKIIGSTDIHPLPQAENRGTEQSGHKIIISFYKTTKQVSTG